jgi:hypothetical protein
MKYRPDWTPLAAITQMRKNLDRLQAYHERIEFSIEHLQAAEGWDDRLACLTWALEANATVKEMQVWHRARNGLDLFAEGE